MKFTNICSAAHFVSYALKGSAEAGKDLARRECRAKVQCRAKGEEYRRPSGLARAMDKAGTYARALGLLNAFLKERPFHSVEHYRYPQVGLPGAAYEALYVACAKAGRPSLAPAIHGRLHDRRKRQEEAIQLADALYRQHGWKDGEFMKWVNAAPVDDVAEPLLQKCLRRKPAMAAS
jgi:hypothetical protein